MEIKNYIYVICDELSPEHYYFRNFITRNRSDIMLQLRFFPKTLDLEEEKDKFKVFKRKMEVVYRDLDLRANEKLWVLINTDQDFNHDKLEETTDAAESNNCHYTISNPNFEAWLKLIDTSLDSNTLKSKESAKLVLDRNKIKEALTKAKQANCENLGDGVSIPGYGCSTIHELMLDILKLNW